MRISFSDAARLAIFTVIVAGMGLSLSACNTTEGFGKDVRNTGTAIKDSAQQNKPS